MKHVSAFSQILITCDGLRSCSSCWVSPLISKLSLLGIGASYTTTNRMKGSINFSSVTFIPYFSNPSDVYYTYM